MNNNVVIGPEISEALQSSFSKRILHIKKGCQVGKLGKLKRIHLETDSDHVLSTRYFDAANEGWKIGYFWLFQRPW